METRTDANNSLLATYSSNSVGLTANVRQNGDVFEIIVFDADSGDEVLSAHRAESGRSRAVCFLADEPNGQLVVKTSHQEQAIS